MASHEEYMELHIKYINALDNWTKDIRQHNKTMQLYMSRIMLHTDTIQAETEHLIPGFFSLIPRRSISRFMREISKAEAKQRGRDLVIKHGSKWFG